MLRLTVENFGVLKNIDIKLNKTNLFIGDNGSGKSTLAKLITVLTDLTISEDEIVTKLKDFNINFLNEKCFIQLQEDDVLIVKIIGSKINFSLLRKKVLQKIEKLKKDIIINNFLNYQEDKKNLDSMLKTLAKNDTKTAKHITEFSKNNEYRNTLDNTDKYINVEKSKYIPAERNLISLFNQSLSNMINAEIPLPKTLLEFSAHYNSARNEIKELDILGMKYKNENAQDRIYYGDYQDDNFLALENSSSGIQSALPLYLTLKSFASKHKSIIIEEPELNLYPQSQIDTIKFMIENRGQSSLSIMTHSPYILSALNLLIFAHKASSNNSILKEKISTIIPQIQHINPDEFSAYLIENGTSKSIKGESTGMIQENAIDEISDILDDEFSELMDIYSEFKGDE